MNRLKCPECGEPIWDLPTASKLAKCWNSEGHASGMTLAFDSDEPTDDESDPETLQPGEPQ